MKSMAELQLISLTRAARADLEKKIQTAKSAFANAVWQRDQAQSNVDEANRTIAFYEAELREFVERHNLGEDDAENKQEG